MNQKIKAEWVAALRSGKYKQGVFFLETHDGKYCCLGVLVDIQGGKCKGLRFPPAQFEAGVTAQQMRHLSSMNDGTFSMQNRDILEQHSFAEIADYIEAKL